MFQPETVLKRDAFSETVIGSEPGIAERLVLRRLDQLAQPGRAIGRWLATREYRALEASQGIEGVPVVVRFDRMGLLRIWMEGTPLQAARPDDPGFYRDAARIVRALHRRGVTHNDLQKPQNWLMKPDGAAAVIDFQLATVSKRRGRLFRIRAYEDLRHLLKQKQRYAPHLLTARERAIVAQRSLPSRIWRRTYKPVYNFITRKLMQWSDGEGMGQRLQDEGPAIRAELLSYDQVHDLALSSYPSGGRGKGLYGFVETDLAADELRGLLPETQVELLQPVRALPRTETGAPRQDLLDLVAMNRIEEIAPLLARDPALEAVMAPIVAGRLNLTDRY
ncbi:MAG: serine/threonine protein kinase [Pseudomonadota bacterium]